MRKIYKKRDILNTDGYLDNSPNRNNPINIIPGGSITTKGVSKPLSVTPVYPNGQGPTQIMYPGKDKNFSGAQYVIEKDNFQEGGSVQSGPEYRQYLISMGMTEGPDLERKVAEYEKGLYMTGLKPGTSTAPLSIMSPTQTVDETFTPSDTKMGPADKGFLHTWKADNSWQRPPVATFQAPENVISLTEEELNNPAPDTAPMPEIGTTTATSNPMLDPGVTGDTTPTERATEKTLAQSIAEQQANARPDGSKPVEEDLNPYTYKSPEDDQQFNPYGGSDMESAMSTLGASVAEGNVAGIIGGGLKAGLSGYRNFELGRANAKARRRAMDNYNKRQRQGIEANSRNAITLKEGGDIKEYLKNIFNVQ